MHYNTFEKVLYKRRNNGAPGNDLISTYWIKKLTSIHKPIVHQFNMVYEQNDTLLEWIAREVWMYRPATHLYNYTRRGKTTPSQFTNNVVQLSNSFRFHST